MIRAAFDTFSLPQTLGNVANKALLKGYASPVATWDRWCSRGSVSDFKTQTRIRVTDMGDWEKVTPQGEIGQGTLGEEYEQYSIGTYGKLVIFDRVQLINDDLQQLTRVPYWAGRRAQLLIAKLVYTHLLLNGNMQDGVALFHATHRNLNTSTPLTNLNLGAAKAAFRKQTDKDGQPVDIEPTFLLAPPDLEQTAREILESDLLILAAAGTTDATVQKGSKNIHKGSLEPVIETRLSNSTYTGSATTTWYLIGDPGDCDTIEVAFLNGKREPTLERVTLQPGVLGLGWQAYIDVGCKALDWRAMQKNTLA
jgi:hypothetical protein